MTSDHRVTPGLIHDILDALERHGYYRSDDLHADRAIGLIGDLACIYEGTQDHPPRLPITCRRPPTPDPAATTPSPSPAPTPAPCSPRRISPPTTSATASRCAPTAPTSPAPTARPTSATPQAFDQMADRMLRAAQAAPAASSQPARARSPVPARRRPGGRPVTPARRKPDEPAHRPAATPLIPDPRPGERDMPETAEPYDLPFPDQWPPGRPEYVIVVDQLRGWRPGQPPSLAELLEAGPARTREPEPDLEAEP